LLPLHSPLEAFRVERSVHCTRVEAEDTTWSRLG
jgi:hypothetical protein